jgi:hypothetical protein
MVSVNGYREILKGYFNGCGGAISSPEADFFDPKLYNSSHRSTGNHLPSLTRKSCFIGAVSVVYAQTHFIDSRDTDNVHSSGVYPFWYTMFLHPDVRHGTSFCYVIPPVLSPLP